MSAARLQGQGRKRAPIRLSHTALSYPIMGRPCADPGEKHEPRAARPPNRQKETENLRRYPARRSDHRSRRSKRRTLGVRLLTASCDREAACLAAFKASSCCFRSEISRVTQVSSSSTIARRESCTMSAHGANCRGLRSLAEP